LPGSVQFTDFRGWNWRVAHIADIPFPTFVGGNTDGCPLDDVCKRAYAERGDEVQSVDVLAALKTREAEVRQCWHHRLTRAEQHYAAELSRLFVERQIQPYVQTIADAVARDGHSDGVRESVEMLFDDPLHWSFTPSKQLGNGRHRLCALKARGVQRVAVTT
jgi:hypothetical protein